MAKKFFYKILLVVFLFVGGIKLQAAPANTIIGTQATLTFLDFSNVEQVVLSNIVTVTINPVNAVTISPGVSGSAFPGEEIMFPVKITNKGNVDTKFSVYRETEDDLLDLKFIIDDNKNGILDDGETTEIQPAGLTPTVKFGESISLITVGKVPDGAVAKSVEKYVIYAKATGNNEVVAFNTNSFTIKEFANVKIVKSIGTTAEPNAFVYVFKITNESSTPGKDIVLTDNLPNNITLTTAEGKWFPFGSSSGKNVDIAATGFEANSDEIDFSVVNGVLTLKVKNIPGNHLENSQGGVLHLNVTPLPNLPGGTLISNTASYTYDNGVGAIVSKQTNTSNYTIPEKALVNVTKSVIDLDDSNSFIYNFHITNNSTITATGFEMVDTLASNVVVDGTTGYWIPYGYTTGKSVPLTATGYEIISDDIDLSVVNGIMTLKVKNIPGNGGLNGDKGGVLQLRVKAKPGTAQGTSISNVAKYKYNNGLVETTDINTNTATYTTPTISLSLEKYQGVDGDGNNVIDQPYTKSALTANPGDKIFYKLVIKNTGNGIVRDLTINDSIADYTTMYYGDNSISAKGKPVWRIGNGAFTQITTVPAAGDKGDVTAIIPLIKAGETAEIYYIVEVDK